jgi:hypothetical protein
MPYSVPRLYDKNRELLRKPSRPLLRVARRAQTGVRLMTD